MRCLKSALFIAVVFLTTLCVSTEVSAQFGGPTPKIKAQAKEKQSYPELELYREKIQKVALLLTDNVEVNFLIKIEFDFLDFTSTMWFVDRECRIDISAEQIRGEIKTEAGLAGVLAHELGHCFQFSEGVMFPTPYRSPFDIFFGYRSRVPEQEIDATKRGVELMFRNPFYTIRDRRIAMQKRLEYTREKKYPQKVIEEYKERLDILLQTERLLTTAGRDGAMYVVFTLKDFQKFREMMIERIQ